MTETDRLGLDGLDGRDTSTYTTSRIGLRCESKGMFRGTTMGNWLKLSPLLALFAVLACTDDFGTPCDFPQSPEVQEICSNGGDQDNESNATCIDTYNADCSSRICVSYQGGDAFCSERCSTDGDCPPESICEIPTGTSQGICLPDSVIN